MRFSTLALLAASATTVFAQSVADLPQCSLQCFIKDVPTTGCNLLDTKCQCEPAHQAQLSPLITPCVESVCNTTEALKVQSVVSGICASYTFAVVLPSSTSAAAVASTTSADVTTPATSFIGGASTATTAASVSTSAVAVTTSTVAVTTSTVAVTTSAAAATSSAASASSSPSVVGAAAPGGLASASALASAIAASTPTSSTFSYATTFRVASTFTGAAAMPTYAAGVAGGVLAAAAVFAL